MPPLELLDTEGRLLTADDFTAGQVDPDQSPMEANMHLPLSVNVHPRALIAPLDAEKRAKFSHGQAGILQVSHEDDYGEGWEEYADEYVTLDLQLDESGQVSAQYSGLILDWNDWTRAAQDRTEGDISEFTATLFQFSDGYAEFEVRPAADPGDPPILAPVDVPYYYEEGMALDAGIQARYRFVVQNADGELKLLDASLERSRLDTGEVLDDGDEYESLIGAVLQNCYVNGDYEEPYFDYCEIDNDGAFVPSLSPVEMLGEDLLVRYHIWYTDGTDEIIVADYPD